MTELRFTDPRTRQQIERLLAGLIENRAKDRRTVSVGFLGEGTRDVAISYVVAAPVWKTAYRIVLPRDGADTPKARLQGWAVVENLTGGDWKDVDLTLVSGNPVALRQPLYTALFANRPEIPVSTGTRVVPRRDDVQEKAAPPAAPQAQFRNDQVAAALATTRAARPLPAAEVAAPLTAAPAAAAGNAAAAEEASTQLLYRFPAKLSLATGHTMMVPFVDRELPVTRVWLYQPDVSSNHPLAAMRLKNDGDSALPAGLVTTFDKAGDGSTNFAGDALLPLTPKDATRLATFAVDTKTAIRRDDKGIVQSMLGKALNGTLTVQTRSTHSIDYEVTAPPDEDRDIVVEERRMAGWTPVAAMTGVEETPTRYRHTISAPRGKTTKARFTTERLDSEQIILTELDIDDMLVRIRGLQNETPALKAVVARLTALVEDMNKAKVQRGQLESERERIARDQERVRNNLQSVGANNDLGRRYVATLKTQEDRLAEIAALDAKLEKEIDARTKAAEDAVRQLTL